MKTLHLFLLAIYTATPVVAKYVREGPASFSRQLQDNTTAAEQIQNDIDSNLPAVNYRLRETLTDPWELDLAATVPLDCNTLVLSMEFSQLTGLSSVEVANLTIFDETLVFFPKQANCDDNLWAAKGDIYVEFGSDLKASQPIKARVSGKCNGQKYNQSLTVSVYSSGVYFTGSYNLEGVYVTDASNATTEIIGGAEKANTLGTLTLNTESNYVTVGNLPSELSDYELTIQNQLLAAFYKQLVEDVEPELRETLEILLPSKGCDVFGLGWRSFTKFFSDLAPGIVDAIWGEVEGSDIFD